MLNGTIEIRGIKKEIKSKVSVTFNKKSIKIKGSFSVNPNDFNIQIPSIVRKKIAQHIKITIDYELVKKK